MINQDSSNQEDYNNQKNQSDSSPQNNTGIGEMSGGKVTGNTKIAGVIDQLQEIIGSNFNQAKNIINIENLFITDPKEASEGSIKVILKGSPTGFEQLEQLLESGELGELIKVLEKEFNIKVNKSSFVDTKNLDTYSKKQEAKTTEKQLAFTISNNINMNPAIIILIIFPYNGYTANSDLEKNFWELIDNCQKHSKYKPIVVINRDTIERDEAISFFAVNAAGNNNEGNAISFFQKNTDERVDIIKDSSVDTCQMWLHGWGEIIEYNDRLPSEKKIQRIIQLPGDIQKIKNHDDFYNKLNGFCSKNIYSTDDKKGIDKYYDIVLGDFETRKFVGKSLIDSYGTFPLIANWFPEISNAIFSLEIYKPRTEFLNIRVDILRKLLEYRKFAYEQTLNMLINSWDSKLNQWKYKIEPYNLGKIEDYPDNREYQGCLDQIERTERMLKYLWRKANAPKDTKDEQKFKKFMDDYDFLCQRSQAICETARVTIRSLLGIGTSTPPSLK